MELHCDGGQRLGFPWFLELYLAGLELPSPEPFGPEESAGSSHDVVRTVLGEAKGGLHGWFLSNFRSVSRRLMASRAGKRRETEATRRRRAALARSRQGPDGKWETNAKKAMARRAKQRSLRIGPLLAAKAEALHSEQLRRAVRAAEALRTCDGAGLGKLLRELKGLSMSSKVMQRSHT